MSNVGAVSSTTPPAKHVLTNEEIVAINKAALQRFMQRLGNSGLMKAVQAAHQEEVKAETAAKPIPQAVPATTLPAIVPPSSGATMSFAPSDPRSIHEQNMDSFSTMGKCTALGVAIGSAAGGGVPGAIVGGLIGFAIGIAASSLGADQEPAGVVHRI